MAWKFGMRYFGVKFWSGDFGGFDFCLYSIIPVTLNSEYSPPSVRVHNIIST